MGGWSDSLLVCFFIFILVQRHCFFSNLRCKYAYFSQVTANLVHHVLRVPKSTLVVLPMETTVLIEGVRVTLLDANHCPGAVSTVFEALAHPFKALKH